MTDKIRTKIIWPQAVPQGWTPTLRASIMASVEAGNAEGRQALDAFTLNQMRVIVPGTKDWANRDAIIDRCNGYGTPVALIETV